MSKKARTNNSGFTLGELVVVFAIVFIVGALLTPVVKYSQRRTDKILCANNLRELGLALYIYAQENEGKFPVALKTLYEEHYLADPKFTDCPAAVARGPGISGDYIYTSGLSARSPSGQVLVRDKSKNHSSGGKNVLYVDGSVAWEG